MKTILLTGATDGIGAAAARTLVAAGHRVLLHGRNENKLAKLKNELAAGEVDTFLADVSRFVDVERLAKEVVARWSTIDVLINNAGVFRVSDPSTSYGLDLRFVVNTLAPYLLTKRLLDAIAPGGRVINLSSAAQAPVNIEALSRAGSLTDMDAYSQSKLAITMWSRSLGLALDSPVIVSVNPASMLGTKMVKEAFGVDGGDVQTGADILMRAALSEEFADKHGQYFDNDEGRFASPHPHALDDAKVASVVAAIEHALVTHHRQP